MKKFLLYCRVARFTRHISGVSKSLPEGPPLSHFVQESLGNYEEKLEGEVIPYIPPEDLKAKGRKGIENI